MSTPCASDVAGSSPLACPGSTTCRAAGGPRLFTPVQVAEVKALACTLPAETGQPLSRWSSADLARQAITRGLAEAISPATVRRWLAADAINPGSTGPGSSRVTRISRPRPSHHGHRSIERIQTAWPTANLVHLPVHASWLNQLEIYFSILQQRKTITPNDFAGLDQLSERIIGFQDRYNMAVTA